MLKHVPLLLTLLSGVPLPVAGYQAQPLESYRARATVGGVTVAVEPYGSDEKSAAAFDLRDLVKRGYFPVYVAIRNETSDYISISTRKVLLSTHFGQSFYTTPAAIVVEDITGGGGFSRTPKSRDAAEGKGGQISLLDALTGKELQNGQVEPGGTVQGFLFFFTPTPRQDFFAGSKLTIPGLTNRGTGRDIGPFEIPLDAGEKQVNP